MCNIPSGSDYAVRRSVSVFVGLFFCVAALSIPSGCRRTDASRGVVSGKVTLDGQPLATGSIAFVPTDGTIGVATGGEIREGAYRLAGNAAPVLGWNRVEIRGVRKNGRTVQKPFAAEGEMIEESAEAIAPRYNTSSTLKTEIKPGNNKADFAVMSK